ncbi:TPA: N-acetyltransferase family protein [Streptococcus suis]
MLIKPMQTEEEIKGKAFVHWKSWQETYADLLPQDFLQKTYTLERCQDWAFRYPQNILVALVDEQVVGFACYGANSQEDLQAALGKMQSYERISLWVLEGNLRAISFYEQFGFRFDGVTKIVKLGADRTEHRMVLERK